MSGADKEREEREQLITELKEALVDASKGDLFMDGAGEVFDNITDAVSDTSVNEVVHLTRYLQLPTVFVHVTDDKETAYLTEAEAEAAAEDED
jgi:hypothetical protein